MADKKRDKDVLTEEVAIKVPAGNGGGETLVAAVRAELGESHPREISPVRLVEPGIDTTSDEAFWAKIRTRTDAVNVKHLSEFLDRAMRADGGVERQEIDDAVRQRPLPFPHVDAYNYLKVATEVFLMKNVGVRETSKHNVQSDGRLLEQEFEVEPVLGGKSAFAEERHEAREFEGEMKEDQRLRDEPDEPQMSERQIQKLYAKYTGDNKIIPYLDIIRLKLKDVRLVKNNDLSTRCYGILRDKLTNPCMIELIWSYWQEEGMLVQAMNAITMRFQNRKGPGARDPLANLELDALRPLNNLLWGFVQDEQHRLSVVRRAYEYDHHYGITLHGKAVPSIRPADSRSRFLEAFHRLLYLCSEFYKQLDDMTIRADGFPVMNALKEVHLLLTQGGHNQYGDLPWTARQEMLMQQWILSRPEMREFIPGRVMVAYPEAWMDRVDAMKSLQGWTDTTVTHFRDLATFGEQLLLGIRYGAWSTVIFPQQAANWARFWRPEIQGYTHAYRAATGVDLTNRTDVDNTPPSILLRRRLAAQSRA